MIKNTIVIPPGDNLVESVRCKGLLFVLCGPAGVGKNSIMGSAMSNLPQLRQLPTLTTRAKRPNEQHGREHYFVNGDQFDEMVANHALVEYQEVYPGKFYGTPRQPMQEALDATEKLIADIDVVGAKKLKEAFPNNVVLIFIAPPSLDDLETRLRHRGNMSEDEIGKRLQRSLFEMSYAKECEYRVVNDTLDNAAAQVIEIIRQEMHKHNCD
jgi:guanylate kinase